MGASALARREDFRLGVVVVESSVVVDWEEVSGWVRFLLDDADEFFPLGVDD